MLPDTFVLFYRQKRFWLCFAVLAVPRFFYFFQYLYTPYFVGFPTGLDSTRFDEFAQQIVAGDFLFQKGVYPQSPLYSYFLAFLYAIFGLELRFWSVRITQIFLGIATGFILYQSAKKLWNPSAASWTLLGYALCPLFPYYEMLFLRTTLSLFLTSFCFLFWLYWLEKPESPLLGTFLGLGIGALFLQEPNYLLIVPFLLVQKSIPWKKLIQFPLIGFASVVFLLVARNYWVEVPLLSVSAQGPVVFVSGHAPDALGVGWYSPPSTEILAKSGHLGQTVLETLRANHGQWENYFQLQIRKGIALFADFEVPNNYHFTFDRTFWLSWISFPLPTFGFFVGFGVIGILLSCFQQRRFVAIAGFFLGSIVSVMAFYILSRFRLVLLLPLLLGTGFFFSQFRCSRQMGILAFLGGMLSFCTYQYSSPDPRFSYGASNLAHSYLARSLQTTSWSVREADLNEALFFMKRAIEESQKEYEKAPDWYLKLVPVPKIRISYSCEYAEILAELSRFEEADSYLKNLETQVTGNSRRIQQAWAFLEIQQGLSEIKKREWESARRLLENAFKRAPQAEIAYYLITVNQELYQKQPHFVYLYNQAQLYLYLQQNKEAISLFQKCLTLPLPSGYQENIQWQLEQLQKKH